MRLSYQKRSRRLEWLVTLDLSLNQQKRQTSLVSILNPKSSWVVPMSSQVTWHLSIVWAFMKKTKCCKNSHTQHIANKLESKKQNNDWRQWYTCYGRDGAKSEAGIHTGLEVWPPKSMTRLRLTPETCVTWDTCHHFPVLFLISLNDGNVNDVAGFHQQYSRSSLFLHEIPVAKFTQDLAFLSLLMHG